MADRERQTQVEVARADGADAEVDGQAEEYLAGSRRPVPAKPLGVVLGATLFGLALGTGFRRRSPGGGPALATVPVESAAGADNLRVRRRRGQR